MEQTPRHIMMELGYLGLLPFLGCLVLMVADISLFGHTPLGLFVTYSAIILSFLSGALWGNAIDHFSHALSRNGMLLSNSFTFIAWAVLLQSPENHWISLFMLAFGYVAVWFTEATLRNSENENNAKGYNALRTRLTIGVVAFHGVALVV
ncbi:DUF3429 domain-containing protein [Vibrio sp. vnigr-6D03]|uniref:DUF3429 domain-containing protein n=1 Tax=Vibrio penaeicida TaxID=104609 RepID=A0AAV5NP85_9VIBR|nr:MULTISPECIES: DUF3429 domain-containing protein [Vibrio]MDP2573603.1 DUF3429 domain-containing protein [Vibrio penaeicida]PKF81173.1 DUF3429 domain-containing protein [Vibrio sp. vnigr-6D03]RTZ23409.1 DUF3429 domain-containing protein [Vibrio penaeicida]GLQ72245.1 hypothetical protein GCM10007932_16050 [Vibrio penaeicida]